MIAKEESEKLFLYCLEELRLIIEPRFCSRYRSEAQKTVAKRAVGAI
jgi:hypothetical protein